MADITPRMTAQEYLLMMGVKPKSKEESGSGRKPKPSLAALQPRDSNQSASSPVCALISFLVGLSSTSEQNGEEIKSVRKNKYNAKRTRVGDEVFDSAKESRTFQTFTLAMNAQSPSERVVVLERSRRYLLVPKQEGERACSYVADFFVVFADGRKEVVDTKSDITRKNPLYVLKRKLMLERHNIRILEM